MGLEAAGMTTVFQCEIDKNCRQTLDYHWPDIPKWDDVSTLTGQYILDHCDGVDVVAWGSPCQDLSVAGKRAGLTGERSGLFHQGIRIIKELRELSNGKYPTWSIWENVAGALSSNNGADFGEVLYEMDEAGACFSEWSMLDAQYFGIPQRRRRVFVISCFDSSIASRCPEQILVVGEGCGGDSSKGKPKGQSVTNEAAEGFGNSGFSKWAGTDQAITLSARDYKGPNTLMVEEPFTPSSHAGYSNGIGTLRANGGDLGGQRNIVGSLQARDYKGVGNQYVMENKLVVQQTPPNKEKNQQCKYADSPQSNVND
jgi:DNA (cytosine-5)-methyltransferase 1